MGSCSSKNTIKASSRLNQRMESTKISCLKFNLQEFEILEHLFKDLALRNSSSVYMEKSSFLSFINLPGIVGDHVFDLLDINKDGLIEINEFLNILEACCRSDSKDIIRKFFTICDYDKDFRLSESEFLITILNFYPALSNKLKDQTEKCTDNSDSLRKPTQKEESYTQFLQELTKIINSDLNELSSKDIVKILITLYSENRNYLTLQDFEKFIGDFPGILSLFTKGFRETLWTNINFPQLKLPKNFNCNIKSLKTSKKQDNMGTLYILHDHSLSKHIGIIRKNLLVIFNSNKPKSIQDVIFLKGCYLKEDCKFEVFIINIFHCTQYDSRLSIAFRSEDKKNRWYDALCLAGNIRKFKDHYTLENKIGLGKFSEVFIGINKKTYTRYAIKVIRKRKLDRFERELMVNEIKILSILDHPNVCKLIDVFDSQKYLMLVLEFIPGGELLHKIRSAELSENLITSIVKQILTVISYIHSVGVIHRDIKPENIILANGLENLHIKLIDFGLATYTYPESIPKITCGTLGYSAPEMLARQGYSSQIDMWSLGVVAYSLITGKLPFYDSDKKVIIEKTIKFDIDYEETVWKNFSVKALDFVQKVLNRNPTERLLPHQALSHDWLIKDFICA